MTHAWSAGQLTVLNLKGWDLRCVYNYFRYYLADLQDLVVLDLSNNPQITVCTPLDHVMPATVIGAYDCSNRSCLLHITQWL